MDVQTIGLVTETHCCECGGDHSCDVCPVFDGMYEDDDDLPTDSELRMEAAR